MSESVSRRPGQSGGRSRVTTLQRHAAARDAGNSSLHLAGLLTEIAYASKIVAREVRVAALTGRLGTTGSANASGDSQKKLDLFANRVFLDSLDSSGLVAGVVSEELEGIALQRCEAAAEFLVCLDPIDGSGNLALGSTADVSTYERFVAGATA